MKYILVLLLTLGVSVSLHAQTPVPADLKTLSGRTYKNARVFRVEPDGITYMYDGGMSKIDFTDLPEAIRKQYEYDPTKAAAFAHADDQAQNAAYWSAQQQQAQIANRKQATVEKEATDASKREEKTSRGGSLDAGREGGLQHFVKQSVDQVATSPYTLKGAMIEMTGIDRIEMKESAAGVYRLTIWSTDGNDLSATLPVRQARIAEKAKSLIVAVKTPDANPVEISILGNGTNHQGLSTVPVAVWK